MIVVVGDVVVVVVVVDAMKAEMDEEVSVTGILHRSMVVMSENLMLVLGLRLMLMRSEQAVKARPQALGPETETETGLGLLPDGPSS